MNDTYYCGRCDRRRLREHFFTHRSGRKKGFPLSICKDCRRKISLSAYHKRVSTAEGREKYNQSQRERNYLPHVKKYKKKTHHKFRANHPVSYYANTLCSASRGNARRKSIPHELTTAWIKRKLVTGVCEATGIPLLLRTSSSGQWSTHPQAPSLDRRDSNKGYTKDNCQIVCHWYNLAKGAWGEEQVRDLIRCAALNWAKADPAKLGVG